MSRQGRLGNRCPKICECFLSIRDVSWSGKQKGCRLRKVAVGNRRVGAVLYPTNPSMRVWKGVAHQSEPVDREGVPWTMWDGGFGAARLMRGTEQERQLPSRPSCLRGSQHAPQLADLDTNLYKEV